jgi:hypothetical protein
MRAVTSTSALALAAIVALLSHALLALPGGTLADRFNRRGHPSGG